MEKTNIFILLLSVGMLIVSCIQINQLTRLSTSLENGGKKILNLKFVSDLKNRVSVNIGILAICAALFFNEFQF